MSSQGTLIHSAPIPKSCLWEHKRSFIKFLQFCTVLHNCQRSKLVFSHMWVISFKIINKHCLNLIQKACVMVIVIRTMNHVGGCHLVPRSIQPRDGTCSILYSSGSFRFRPVSRTSKNVDSDIRMSC